MPKASSGGESRRPASAWAAAVAAVWLRCLGSPTARSSRRSNSTKQSKTDPRKRKVLEQRPVLNRRRLQPRTAGAECCGGAGHACRAGRLGSESTCITDNTKRPRRIDPLWVSPEMQALLLDVELSWAPCIKTHAWQQAIPAGPVPGVAARRCQPGRRKDGFSELEFWTKSQEAGGT